MSNIAIFIFTRDLRLHDHVGAPKNNTYVPVFMVTSKQLNPKHNPYYSPFAAQYLFDALDGLHNTLKQKHGSRLCILQGSSYVTMLTQLHKRVNFASVAIAKDVTPFATLRATEISRWCNSKSIQFDELDDLDILPLTSARMSNGAAYRLYSPFVQAANKMTVERPDMNHLNWADATIVPKSDIDLPTLRKRIIGTLPLKCIRGHPEDVTKAMSRIARLKNYSHTRDYPCIDGTSRLSPHIRFGTVSPREVYWKIHDLYGAQHGLLKELYWRSFFMRVTQDHPKIIHGQPLQDKYSNLKWKSNSAMFKAWTQGTTGFPFVDAGMRCLAQTGWLHNRLRMLVACLLVRNMHLDWRLGMRYFASTLVDSDPSNNDNNWQWVVGCGANAMPYFRTFNPFAQSKKYDKDCEYIYEWVPELRTVSPKHIHTWSEETAAMYPGVDYPPPILDLKSTFVKYKSAVSNL